MKTLGNILWHFPFFGFVNAIFVYLLGLLLTLTVVAAPIGLGLMEFGKFLLHPFGHEMISKKELNEKQNVVWEAYSTIVRILYFPFGFFLCIAAIIQVAFLFFTIIGIPVALVIAKSLGTYFNPVNKKCVHGAVKQELERRKAQEQIDKHLGSTGDRTISPISKETYGETPIVQVAMPQHSKPEEYVELHNNQKEGEPVKNISKPLRDSNNLVKANLEGILTELTENEEIPSNLDPQLSHEGSTQEKTDQFNIDDSSNSTLGKTELNKVTIIGAIALIIGFLLPWIKTFLGSFSGYDIMSMGNKLGVGDSVFFLVLLPIGAGIVLYGKLNQEKVNDRLIKVSQITIILVHIYIFVKLNEIGLFKETDFHEALGIGFYASVFGAITMLVDLIQHLPASENTKVQPVLKSSLQPSQKIVPEQPTQAVYVESDIVQSQDDTGKQLSESLIAFKNEAMINLKEVWERIGMKQKSNGFLTVIQDFFKETGKIEKTRIKRVGIISTSALVLILVGWFSWNLISKTGSDELTSINKINQNQSANFIKPEPKSEETPLTISQAIRSYSAVINDQDGYTNIRENRSSNSKVITRILEGQYFTVLKSGQSNWWPAFTQDGSEGYIHKSRVNLKKPIILGQYPQASEKYLTTEELQDFSEEELNLIRNEIFARYGYRFKNQRLNDHFYEQSWYAKLDKLEASDDASTYLSKIEKINIELLLSTSCKKFFNNFNLAFKRESV